MPHKYIHVIIGEQLTRCGREANIPAVLEFFQRRDGDPREDVLLQAVLDGTLIVRGWCHREGPLYFAPDPRGGFYWEQVAAGGCLGAAGDDEKGGAGQ